LLVCDVDPVVTVTVTSTDPVTVDAGLVAVQVVIVEHETDVAGVVPKFTTGGAAADVGNPVPLMVT